MSQIKNCIHSRWGTDGVIIQADYKQLEVYGLAYLSKDTQLKSDLLNGLDMHCVNASFIYNETYENIKKFIDQNDPVWIDCHGYH